MFTFFSSASVEDFFMRTKTKKWLLRIKTPIEISISLDPDHMMVRLAHALDWKKLIEIAQKHRLLNIKKDVGVKPDLRVNVGAIIVRMMRSCTLREAMDLIQHFAPARYLCGLQESERTVDYQTIHDSEKRIGAKGVQEMEDYIISVARELGFADIRGLCADTTAQEAAIPYPTDVGMMGSFARSIAAAVKTLKPRVNGLKTQIKKGVEKVAKLVRSHRLFCKNNQQKTSVEKQLLKAAKSLGMKVKKLVKATTAATATNFRGARKKAWRKLQSLTETFTVAIPQIDHYIKNRAAVKGKIVSLFMPMIHAIKRGKVGKNVEFGLKILVNQIRGGYITMQRVCGLSEYDCAVAAVDSHVAQFGQPPEEFGYDRGGWSKSHIKKIKKRGVKRVAIAPKGKAKWLVSKRCRDRMMRERAQTEGKIGTTKNYELNRPRARTEDGMERSMARSSCRFNLTKLLKDTGKLLNLKAYR